MEIKFEKATVVRGETGHCVKWLKYSTKRAETKSFRAHLDEIGAEYVKTTPTVTHVLMVRYTGTKQGVDALCVAAHHMKTRFRRMTEEIVYLDGVQHAAIAKIAPELLEQAVAQS